MSMFEILTIAFLVFIVICLLSIIISIDKIKDEVGVMFNHQHDKPPWYRG